jgi:triacylglycerol lipase
MKPPSAHRLVLALSAGIFIMASTSFAREHVILLHGLCRTKRSMAALESELRKAGYTVVNADYPSRSGSIAQLADDAIPKALEQCRREGAATIHFVTHSMGGILVRSYLSRHATPELGRVVMLGPPNQGSEVVDVLGRFWIFGVLNGPSGRELGTRADSTPQTVGPVNFPVGVIAGNRSINWINSLFIRGPDDGKVSVERTKVTGMTDHIVLPSAHPFLMRNRLAIAQTIHFLRTGSFDEALKR